jgi:hypothetical protein
MLFLSIYTEVITLAHHSVYQLRVHFETIRNLCKRRAESIPWIPIQIRSRTYRLMGSVLT